MREKESDPNGDGRSTRKKMRTTEGGKKETNDRREMLMTVTVRMKQSNRERRNYRRGRRMAVE